MTETVDKVVAICPKCGRESTCPPAISRVDNETEICPVCGVIEALEAAGIKKEEAEEIIRCVEAKEISMGRVKPLCSDSQYSEHDESNSMVQCADTDRSTPV